MKTVEDLKLDIIRSSLPFYLKKELIRALRKLEKEKYESNY